MRVGITGHQARNGISWAWIKRAVRIQLAQLKASQAMSSLAAGSDQIFAEVALILGIEVLAVVPLRGYEAFFDGGALTNYRRLLKRCTLIELSSSADPERAFFEAGKYIVDHSKVLFAIWDGCAAEGLGGTADVVAYAHRSECRIIHINPISETIKMM